ncbi:thiamine pyrophosphate-binding protein [Quadrisphaera granulorum]|nr:thiamine pyrophosphate-binding protein [Quadrisphaera granulorum]
MSVAELVGRAVAKLGADRAFGVVGSGNFDVTNALVEAGVPFTAARHEGGAATMADAHARTTGRVAVVTLHQGCGLTNALTGIAEAAKSRTPVLVLAADVAGYQVRSNFRVDADALVAAVGAVPERLHSPASAVDDVVRAWRTASEQRRTVVLSMPLDVQAAPAPEGAAARVEALVPPPAAVPARPAQSAVDALAAALRDAQRPVLLAGRGARGHGEVLRALGEASGALLATTAVAKGLFTGDDFDLGICGGFASDLTAELVAGADLVVALGASLTQWTTRHGRLLPDGVRVVQVDREVEQLGVQRAIDLPVLGDVGETAAAVLSALRAAPRTGLGYRTAEVRAAIAERARWADVPVLDEVTQDDDGHARIDPRVLSRELDRRLPLERVLATDSGNFMGYPSAYLSVPDEQGFCFTQSFQCVGLGLATLVGAALASPDRLPVLGTGDGGFLMGASELETVVRLGIGAVIVIYDDAAYGAEVHHFGPAGADTTQVRFPDIDLAALARGAGAEAHVVRSVADLKVLDDWLAGPRDVPLVLDAKVAEDGGSWWLAEAFRAH